ncbi:hypothetical protein JCM19237_126 [Photobacterium aphoticum]|uniref:Uncharacterized protein n=1 Tax=Photobacterium aphoticum TaxID=754436 RepID=A0A090R3D5_9GAMM|nr:hypothetical protein JCM19237_126 [Photobacterium aphoticum]
MVTASYSHSLSLTHYSSGDCGSAIRKLRERNQKATQKPHKSDTKATQKRPE